jgi:hypothetical protein
VQQNMSSLSYSLLFSRKERIESCVLPKSILDARRATNIKCSGFVFLEVGQGSARPSILSMCFWFYEKEEEKIIAKSLIFF